MDPFVNERDFALLARDRCAFEVLNRILRDRCDLILSDHEQLILCHSAMPHPVWIWTPDGLPEAEKARAWALAEQERPLAAGYRFNMKYELANYFIARGRQAGLNVGYFMQLFAYDCPDPVPPEQATDGEAHRCLPEDAEEAAAMLPLFYAEIGQEPPAADWCLERARRSIDEGAFYFWKNAAGRAVACCGVRRNQGAGSLGPVFTLPEHRRRRYAQHLVYHVTKAVKEEGLVPMLYTDADYAASNACYEKIGYVLRGRLCTVAALE